MTVDLSELAGNAAAQDSSTSFAVDVTAPTLATISADTSSGLSGAAEAGASVSVVMTDPSGTDSLLSTTADATTGAWSIAAADILGSEITSDENGTYAFSVSATDAAGNTSEAAGTNLVVNAAVPKFSVREVLDAVFTNTSFPTNAFNANFDFDAGWAEYSVASEGVYVAPDVPFNDGQVIATETLRLWTGDVGTVSNVTHLYIEKGPDERIGWLSGYDNTDQGIGFEVTDTTVLSGTYQSDGTWITDLVNDIDDSGFGMDFTWFGSNILAGLGTTVADIDNYEIGRWVADADRDGTYEQKGSLLKFFEGTRDIDGGGTSLGAVYYDEVNDEVMLYSPSVATLGTFDLDYNTSIFVEKLPVPLTLDVSILGTDNSDDPLFGTWSSDVIYGLDGDDIIDGLDGDDKIIISNGNNGIYGDAGSDQFIILNNYGLAVDNPSTQTGYFGAQLFDFSASDDVILVNTAVNLEYVEEVYASNVPAEEVWGMDSVIENALPDDENRIVFFTGQHFDDTDGFLYFHTPGDPNIDGSYLVLADITTAPTIDNFLSGTITVNQDNVPVYSLQQWIINQYNSNGSLRPNFTQYAELESDHGILINSTDTDITLTDGKVIPAGKIVYNDETADLQSIYDAAPSVHDIRILGSSGNDHIDLSQGPFDTAKLFWSEGQDYLKGNDQTQLRLGSHDGALTINLSDEPLIIESGNNRTEFGSQVLQVKGTAFDDVLIGNELDNKFSWYGNNGDNKVTGGTGQDTFEFEIPDYFSSDTIGTITITDYESGEKIWFTDSNSLTADSFTAIYMAGSDQTAIQMTLDGNTYTPVYVTGEFNVDDINVTPKNWYELTLVEDTANGNPTGSITISGTASEGQVLTVDTSSLADEDGLGALSYQWFANDEALVNLSPVTLYQRFNDQGGIRELFSYKLIGSAHNEDGNGHYAFELTFYKQLDNNIVEKLDVPSQITPPYSNYFVSAGSFYELVPNTSTLTLTQSEVGKIITTKVSYTDDGGTSESVMSAATSAVTSVNDNPTGTVSITGTATEGQVLTVDTSNLADEDGLAAFSYQWLRGDADITGATSETYTLAQADVGAAISARVSYTDNGGTAESVTSSATGSIINVNDAPSGSITISGTASEGQVLTVDTSSLADEDGLGALSYQWFAKDEGWNESSPVTLYQRFDDELFSYKLIGSANNEDGNGHYAFELTFYKQLDNNIVEKSEVPSQITPPYTKLCFSWLVL